MCSNRSPSCKGSLILVIDFLTLTQTNAATVWINPATDYADVPEYNEVDSEQAWFWSASWQAAEREADSDLANGRYEDFDAMDEFLESL